MKPFAVYYNAFMWDRRRPAPLLGMIAASTRAEAAQIAKERYGKDFRLEPVSTEAYQSWVSETYR
jgi:hypothetical protein